MKEIKMKKRVLINGKKIIDKTSLYAYLHQQFNFPYPIGQNLDALWDVLSHNQTLKKITIIHSEVIKHNLNEYADALIDLFKSLQKERNIEIVIYEGKRNETK